MLSCLQTLEEHVGESDYCQGWRHGSSRGRRVIAKEVDDRQTKEQAAENSSSRKQRWRSIGPVDRPQYQKIGRPARSTDVHNMQGSESGRPPGRPSRLIVSTQLSVGYPVDRSVDPWKGSVDRPVDRQAGRAAFLFWKPVGINTGFWPRVLKVSES